MKNKRFLIILSIVAFLLLIPAIAMQFTEEVNWNLLDFAIAGVLLFGTGLLIELVLKKVKIVKYQIAICIVLLLSLCLIWAELAVGIFGTPLSGN